MAYKPFIHKDYMVAQQVKEVTESYQVEVIFPGERTNELYAQIRAIAVEHGQIANGNFDLTGERPDPNSFHLFSDLEKATQFREAIFESGISRAVYILGINAKGPGKHNYL